MEKLKSGDVQALEHIYFAMKKSVYLLSLSILSNAEKAKDVLQETFIKVAQSIHTYKPNTNAKAWICTIARNLCYGEYSKAKNVVSLEGVIADIPDNKNSAEAWVQNILLQKAMQSLSPLESEIVTLFSLEGYRHREIAQITKKPLGTVLWIYHRAIKKLKDFMGDKNEI